MKRMSSLKEQIAYITVKFLNLIFMALPVGIALFLGKVTGLLAYYLDTKHKNLAYTHIRLGLSERFSPHQTKGIVKRLFMNFGQSLVETLRLSKMNIDYVKKYIEIEGEEFLEDALRKGRGVITFGSHFGSWEIFFIAAPLLGYKLSIFAREQYRLSSLDRLLNEWRKSKGCRIITRGREVINRLKKNEIIGLVSDHGGREGIPVNFFGRKALTPTGVIRFASLLNTPILPIYIVRIRGRYHKIKILPPLILEETGDRQKDLIINLEKINRILEDYISRFPEQYLWFYKRWKYSHQRDILVLSDGKAGHSRQLESLVKAIREVAEEKGLEIRSKKVEVIFKNRYMKRLPSFCVSLASRDSCRSCLWCLRRTLDRSSYKELERTFADMVVSCGTSMAAINFVLSSELKARSIHIMKPGILSVSRFDLVIMPEHDLPPKRRNIVATKGSLNLIDDKYLKEQKERLVTTYNLHPACRQAGVTNYKLKTGLLIGGDAKNFQLSKDAMEILIKGLKRFLEEKDGDIFITTSRRTPQRIEDLVKKEFLDEPRCKFLVIANENNLPFAVGGILGLSDIVVLSPDSISMVSEAASSGKYVFVFRQKGLPKRKKSFLKNLEESSYIRTVSPDEIDNEVKNVLDKRPFMKRLDDYSKIKEVLKKIL